MYKHNCRKVSLCNSVSSASYLPKVDTEKGKVALKRVPEKNNSGLLVYVYQNGCQWGCLPKRIIKKESESD